MYHLHKLAGLECRCCLIGLESGPVPLFAGVLVPTLPAGGGLGGLSSEDMGDRSRIDDVCDADGDDAVGWKDVVDDSRSFEGTEPVICVSRDYGFTREFKSLEVFCFFVFFSGVPPGEPVCDTAQSKT